MIFLTVGSDLPFDRLVKIVDSWAAAANREDVFAQIGSGEYVPRAFGYERFLEPSDFNAAFRSATAIIAHAGMGTILSALQQRKPIVVFPRRAEFHEIRNDHQLATVDQLAHAGGVHVARDESRLRRALDEISDLDAPEQIGEFADDKLIEFVRGFISTSAPTRGQPYGVLRRYFSRDLRT